MPVLQSTGIAEYKAEKKNYIGEKGQYLLISLSYYLIKKVKAIIVKKIYKKFKVKGVILFFNYMLL